MPFRIIITDDSCQVMEQRTRTLVDQNTGEVVVVPLGPHSAAVGLGDFTTIDDKTGEKTVDTQAYLAAVEAKVAPFAGAKLAADIAAAALATESLKAAQA